MQRESKIPEPGEIFEGRYRIDGLLGEGGMGVVLRATHALMETPVAIKMLHPELAGQPQSISRFLREARNAAAVRSEHVGQVLDVAKTAAGLPYIVMEFLPGVDLAVLCEQRRQFAVAEAATYILQACVAVAEAHAIGIVHRDIKPSNLFLTSRPDGTPLVKVFDFGISKRNGEGAEDTETLTQTGMALGTPCYMSPEQISNAKDVDERADVWSFGVMLYEMLSGRLPFEGETAAAVMAQVAVATPAPLSKLRPDLPEALASVVHACLEKNPEKRIQNVGQLADAIRPFAPTEFQGLAVRVNRTRTPPVKRPTDTPAEAFRRVLADAETVVGPANKPPPPKEPKTVSTPPVPLPPEKAAPPTDYARRTFGVAVYVAVLVTVFVAVALLRPAAPTAPPIATAAPPPASEPTSPAETASLRLPSSVTTTTEREPPPAATATGAALASGAAGAKTRAPGTAAPATSPRKDLGDFVADPGSPR